MKHFSSAIGRIDDGIDGLISKSRIPAYSQPRRDQRNHADDLALRPIILGNREQSGAMGALLKSPRKLRKEKYLIPIHWP